MEIRYPGPPNLPAPRVREACLERGLRFGDGFFGKELLLFSDYSGAKVFASLTPTTQRSAKRETSSQIVAAVTTTRAQATASLLNPPQGQGYPRPCSSNTGDRERRDELR